MALHLISSINSDKLAQMRALLQEQDAIALIGDGVYAQQHLQQQLQPLNQTIYVRSSDLKQRGLQPLAHVQSISDSQWVALTLVHAPVISWHD